MLNDAHKWKLDGESPTHVDAEEQQKPWYRTLADVEPETVEPLGTTLPLFRRKVHTLAGDGESGKTWLAIHSAAELAAAGKPVLILDGEMSESSWRLRLEQLGADPTNLSHIDYARMGEVTAHRLRHEVEPFALVVVDSAVTYLSRFARSENDNAEVTRAYDPIVAAARSGPGVLIVDHLSRATATAVPRGATAKFTALDIAYGVTLTDGSRPNKETEWASTITVEKDRDSLIGHRRDYAATYTPLGDGQLHLDIAETWNETHRLSTNAADNALAQVRALDPPPKSANDAARRIGGTRSLVLAAYKRYVNESVL